MENWRSFLEQQESQSLPEQRKRAAAIIWNDPSYKPVEDLKKKSNILKAILPDDVPQGHAGIVLIKELSKNKVRAVSYQFGIGGTQCPKANQTGLIDTIKHKIGIFVPGGVRVKKRFYQTKGENFFDTENKAQNIIEILSKSGLGTNVNSARQFGFVPDINFEASHEYATSPRCRLYTIIPQMGGSMGDNCGSFALKVAAAGLQGMQSGQVSKDATTISNMFVGPDEMLPILQDLGWVSFSMSF